MEDDGAGTAQTTQAAANLGQTVAAQGMRAGDTGCPPTRVKLIFNSGSGAAAESPSQLLAVISEMQAWNLIPEIHLVQAETDLAPVIHEALHHGIRLVVVSGGDNTVDSVAAALVGKRATLGIVPTGRRNNLAMALGIPRDIPAAVALLRTGKAIKMDMGFATCGEIERPFVESCSVGLIAALFPAADDIQHGNLGRIGEFMATLAGYPLIEMSISLNNKKRINCRGHGVLITNVPFVGPNWLVADNASLDDGRLDVLVLAETSKLDLLGRALQPNSSTLSDWPIQHHRVARVSVETDPLVSVMTDGTPCEAGPVQARIQRHAVTIISGAAAHHHWFASRHGQPGMP